MKINSFLNILFISLFIVSISCTPSSDKMFTLMPSSFTGIKFKNPLIYTESFNVLTYGNFYYGGGVSIGDINNDGLPDIYFTGNMVGSRLYLNQGNFKFKEIAEQAGVFAEGLWNTGTTMADVNGDGLIDIYVCRSAASNPEKRRNLLFINNGDLTFTEKAKLYGVDDSGFSTQGAFFDYDNDGDLDLYVLNHSVLEYSTLGKMTKYHKKLKNYAYSDRLLRNDNGKFVDVSDEAGLISNILGFGLGVALSDINNDGFTDIYVSNDFNEQDYLYLNNGDGTFKEKLEEYIGHTSLYSMGSDIADFNNDGFTDIMTLDMLPEGNHRLKMTSGPDNYEKLSHLQKNDFYNQTMRNMLQLNRGGDYFSEIGQFSGVSNSDWSWASLFTDLDNDGLKDLFITNGYFKDYTNMDFLNFIVQEKINERMNNVKMKLTELIDKMPSIFEENHTYKNNGDLTFTKMNKDWGIDQKTFSNAATYADLDNDGDMDLIVTNLEDQVFIYRNNSEKLKQNNYLKIALIGLGENTSGIGAKLKVISGGITQIQEMYNTRGYQSSVDFNLNFGIGKSKTIDEVEVIWPNQKKQIIRAVQPNQKLVLFQKDAKLDIKKSNRSSAKLFEELKTIDFTHQENNHNDFKREIMLPHMLSTQGPKLAVGDIDGDGLEDVFIGGAKGSASGLFIQKSNGEFIKSVQKEIDNDFLSEDMGALFFDVDNDKDMDLYVVSGGNEFQAGENALKDRLYLNNGEGEFVKSKDRLPDFNSSGSVVTAEDFDNDGDLDLFIGGRVLPNQYPFSPNSYLLENDGKGFFKEVTESKAPGLKNVGMVTDALWTDYNNDGYQDLVLVGEWMPITFFSNKKGTFTNDTDLSGLSNTQGWWNTITMADFDQDGDMDFIAGNFGLNSQLKTSEEMPVNIIAKDFDQNGSIDPILSSYYQGKNYPVFSKDDIQQQLSFLKKRFVKYKDYAGLTIEDVFTEEELKDAKIWYAKNFHTSYIENLGEGIFKTKPLPNETQLSPIFGLTTGDFNNDGNLDVILAGNFTATRVKFGHYDAIKGIYLMGDGKGNFDYVDASETGLLIDGEVRNIKQITSSKGEKHLIFSRNNSSPKVFKIHSSD